MKKTSLRQSLGFFSGLFPDVKLIVDPEQKAAAPARGRSIRIGINRTLDLPVRDRDGGAH